MKRKLIILLSFLLITFYSQAQVKLEDIFSTIVNNHPDLKEYDAQIRSLNEAAKGARNWEAPLLSSGLYMTPYNPSMWKKQMDGSNGMGQYMISAQQMFPNKKMQNAESKYMSNMSTVEVDMKQATINDLYAQAKKNYYQWIIAKKKLAVLDQSQKVLDFMINDAELRYKNNLGKISAYYKAKAALGNIQKMKIMIENEIIQKKISLNTLMNRNKYLSFDIDTTFSFRNYTEIEFDSTVFINARSDIKSIEKEIQLTSLQQDVEKAKQRPEFGLRYDHMFGFGGLPMQYSLMGMLKLPIPTSKRSSKANIESLKWKAESLKQQRLGIINEASGMAAGMRNEIVAGNKQIKVYIENIIPALQRNFQTMQIAYQNNTEELFELYDAWDVLNMTQLQYLDSLEQLLVTQAELERILEIN